MSIIQNIQSMFQVGACKKKKKQQKYEWQHFVSYQRTKTGYNGLYQTAKKHDEKIWMTTFC